MNNNEELNSLLKRGEEVLERSRAVRAALEEQEKRNQQASEGMLKDMHNKSDDIHRDYMEHCQQQRQHLNDLHARELAMMDLQIESAKAVPKTQPAMEKLNKLTITRAVTLKRAVPKTKPAPQAQGPKYRAIHKRAIKSVLIQQPNCTDYQLCLLLDEEGIELPTSLQKNGDRTFQAAYRDKTRKNKIESIFSKVRRNMRSCGILAN